MRRELPLLGGLAAVVLLAALLAVAVPGALAGPPEEPDRPGFLDLQEMTISHGTVGGGTVPLSVQARVSHRGPPSENVTVLFRAVGRDSGLLEATETVDVGTVEDEREVPVDATLPVPRRGGYRIEAVVYADGRRVSEGRTTVAGVGSLTPAYADTAVDFHRFDGTLPSVEYSVDDVVGNRTTLNVTTYLTNGGDDPSEDVRVQLTARQADSNIVADRETVRVGAIPAGRTVRPNTELTVPDGYNYYLDAVVWKDGVVVSSTRSAATLDPTETLQVNETRRSVGLRVEDFETDGGREPREMDEQTTETAASAEQPGFGLGVAVAALVLGLSVLAYRSDPDE